MNHIYKLISYCHSYFYKTCSEPLLLGSIDNDAISSDGIIISISNDIGSKSGIRSAENLSEDSGFGDHITTTKRISSDLVAIAAATKTVVVENAVGAAVADEGNDENRCQYRKQRKGEMLGIVPKFEESSEYVNTISTTTITTSESSSSDSTITSSDSSTTSESSTSESSTSSESSSNSSTKEDDNSFEDVVLDLTNYRDRSKSILKVPGL